MYNSNGFLFSTNFSKWIFERMKCTTKYCRENAIALLSTAMNTNNSVTCVAHIKPHMTPSGFAGAHSLSHSDKDIYVRKNTDNPQRCRNTRDRYKFHFNKSSWSSPPCPFTAHRLPLQMLLCLCVDCVMFAVVLVGTRRKLSARLFWTHVFLCALRPSISISAARSSPIQLQWERWERGGASNKNK